MQCDSELQHTAVVRGHTEEKRGKEQGRVDIRQGAKERHKGVRGKGHRSKGREEQERRV